MTPLLQKAFDRAAQLPQAAQDRLGAQLLTELEADGRWDELFADPKSEALLSTLASAALKEHRAEKITPGGFGRQ